MTVSTTSTPILSHSAADNAQKSRTRRLGGTATEVGGKAVAPNRVLGGLRGFWIWVLSVTAAFQRDAREGLEQVTPETYRRYEDHRRAARG